MRKPFSPRQPGCDDPTIEIVVSTSPWLWPLRRTAQQGQAFFLEIILEDEGTVNASEEARKERAAAATNPAEAFPFDNNANSVYPAETARHLFCSMLS